MFQSWKLFRGFSHCSPIRQFRAHFPVTSYLIMIFKIRVVIKWIANIMKQQLIHLYLYLFDDESVPNIEIISWSPQVFFKSAYSNASFRHLIFNYDFQNRRGYHMDIEFH